MHDIYVQKNMNQWNNRFYVTLEWTNEASKFVT
jgi:hypothetical protein